MTNALFICLFVCLFVTIETDRKSETGHFIIKLRGKNICFIAEFPVNVAPVSLLLLSCITVELVCRVFSVNIAEHYSIIFCFYCEGQTHVSDGGLHVDQKV